MDILLSRNGFKCAVFKISDVQCIFSYPFADLTCNANIYIFLCEKQAFNGLFVIKGYGLIKNEIAISLKGNN